MFSGGFATIAPFNPMDTKLSAIGGRRTRKNRKNLAGGEYPDAAAVVAARSAGLLGGGDAIGSKAEVYHGSAARTSGGLTRKDLTMNKRGRIVSLKQQAAGKKAFSRLVKAGYKPKKGTFKLFTRKN